MLVAYFSLTGNVHRFIDKLGMDSIEITEDNPFIKVREPFVVVAPTYDKSLTEHINDFIEFNKPELFKGVIGSGNLNFAGLYVFTAKDIAKEYNVPLLYSFEFSGTSKDIQEIREILEGLE